MLPFRLSTARLIFSKVLRELLWVWRCQGIQAACFLDEGLLTNVTKQFAQHNALQIQASLIAAGCVPHREKSIWMPIQVLTWLGFTLDLMWGMVFCSDQRITNAELLSHWLLNQSRVHVRLIANLRSMLASSERSHGDIVHMMYRFMNLMIAEATSWNRTVNVTPPPPPLQ